MGKLSQNKDCLRGGCESWFNAYARTGEYIEECWRCGFNVLEAERRKKTELTLCDDGLRRKIIPKKPVYAKTEEAPNEKDSDAL